MPTGPRGQPGRGRRTAAAGGSGPWPIIPRRRPLTLCVTAQTRHSSAYRPGAVWATSKITTQPPAPHCPGSGSSCPPAALHGPEPGEGLRALAPVRGPGGRRRPSGAVTALLVVSVVVVIVVPPEASSRGGSGRGLRQALRSWAASRLASASTIGSVRTASWGDLPASRAARAQASTFPTSIPPPAPPGRDPAACMSTQGTGPGRPAFARTPGAWRPSAPPPGPVGRARPGVRFPPRPRLQPSPPWRKPPTRFLRPIVSVLPLQRRLPHPHVGEEPLRLDQLLRCASRCSRTMPSRLASTSPSVRRGISSSTVGIDSRKARASAEPRAPARSCVWRSADHRSTSDRAFFSSAAILAFAAIAAPSPLPHRVLPPAVPAEVESGRELVRIPAPRQRRRLRPGRRRPPSALPPWRASRRRRRRTRRSRRAGSRSRRGARPSAPRARSRPPSPAAGRRAPGPRARPWSYGPSSRHRVSPPPAGPGGLGRVVRHNGDRAARRRGHVG